MPQLYPKGPCPQCADGLLMTRTSRRVGDMRQVFLRCDRCDFRPEVIYIADQRRIRGKGCATQQQPPRDST